MKKQLLLFPISFFLIVSCGKTSEEKNEIAIISCNILEASLDTESSQRIKEINRAREELNEEPFLGKDDEIKQAINYNLCKDLVLNDELYEESLQIAIEQEKIAEEEAIKAAKIAREKEEEEEREKIKKWAEENKKILEKKTIPLEFVKFTNKPSECYDSEYLSQTYPLIICYKKNNFTGFDVMWEVIFKNGYRHVASSMTLISFYEVVYDFHLDEKTLIELESSSNDLEQHVEEVNIYVTGINKKYSENNNLLASEIYSLSSMPLDVLKYNYYETLGIKYKIYPTDR